MGKPQTAVEVLIAARELISVPERWTRGVYSLIDENDEAVCWCGAGAVYAAADRAGCNPEHARCLLNDAVGTGYIIWNDDPNRTHAEVLAAFDKAIELARAEEA
jgi:hypothetical protein